PPGRPDRRAARLTRRGGPVQTGALEHPHFAARDSPGVRLQRRGRAVLRHLAGPPGGEPRSDRRAAVRIECGVRNSECGMAGPADDSQVTLRTRSLHSAFRTPHSALTFHAMFALLFALQGAADGGSSYSGL